MMTAELWTPSPALAEATIGALNDLARHWKHAMSLALEGTEAGRRYQNDFAFALKDADLRAVRMVARQWVAKNQMPPNPAALGALSEEITQQHFPRPEVARPRAIIPPILDGPDQSRIEFLFRRAEKALGGSAPVRDWIAVWGWLAAHAENDENRARIRRGDVPNDVFDNAVNAVKDGQRATPGPLATTIAL